MNRESGVSGFRISIVVVLGIILLFSTGALARYWLIGGVQSPAPDQPRVVHAMADHPRTGRVKADHDPIKPESWLFADPMTGPFDLDPTTLDDAICGGDMDQIDAMLQDWTPDHGDDPDDWLLALATIMGLAEGWTNDAAGPWNSCHM